MPRSRARRHSTHGNLPMTPRRARERRGKGKQPAMVAAAREPRPIRGVKLKIVSLWTMLFALACLGAFIAGRPPVSAARLVPAAGVERVNVHVKRKLLRGVGSSAQSHYRAAREARQFKGR